MSGSRKKPGQPRAAGRAPLPEKLMAPASVAGPMPAPDPLEAAVTRGQREAVGLLKRMGARSLDPREPVDVEGSYMIFDLTHVSVEDGAVVTRTEKLDVLPALRRLADLLDPRSRH